MINECSVNTLKIINNKLDSPLNLGRKVNTTIMHSLLLIRVVLPGPRTTNTPNTTTFNEVVAASGGTIIIIPEVEVDVVATLTGITKEVICKELDVVNITTLAMSHHSMLHLRSNIHLSTLVHMRVQ
jgi:hypothetical protein